MELIQLKLETPEQYKRRLADQAIDEIMGIAPAKKKGQP